MTGAQVPAGAVATPLESRLSDPKVVNALATLLDHADLLAVLVEGLDLFLGRSQVIGDSLINGIRELRGPEGSPPGESLDLTGMATAGIQLAALLPKATPGMVEAVESGAVEKLLASGVVSAEALPQVELLARALVRGSEDFERQPIEVSGPLTLLRLFKDPEISRALSFFATVAKSVGRELGQAAT